MTPRATLVVLLLVLTACTTSPTGRQQLMLVSGNQMQQMGISAFQQMKQDMPVSKDARVNDYVICIADAITQQLPADTRQNWEVVVFEDDSPNAFALPGGKIGVHTGLLDVADNANQLAAVVAHEVAHVLSQHGAERVSQQFATQTGLDLVGVMAGGNSQTKQQLMGVLGLGAQYGILLPYSRAQESEADIYGLELMAKAGFDPRASVALWQNMKATGSEAPPEFMSTHPASDTRIQQLQKQMSQVMPHYNEAVKAGNTPACRR